jgi:hypothetical protein
MQALSTIEPPMGGAPTTAAASSTSLTVLPFGIVAASLLVDNASRDFSRVWQLVLAVLIGKARDCLDYRVLLRWYLGGGSDEWGAVGSRDRLPRDMDGPI